MNSSHLKPTKTTNNQAQLYMPVVLSRQWTVNRIILLTNEKNGKKTAISFTWRQTKRL